MKKIAVLVLVLFIAMALCSCGNNSPEIAELQSRLDALEQENKDLKEQSQEEISRPSEEEYKTFALNWADGVRKELEKQNILIKEATINQALLKDSDWINKMVDSASKLKSSCQSFIDYDKALVPDIYSIGHDSLILCAKDYIKAMDFIIDGAKNDNIIGSLSNVAEYVKSAAVYLSQGLVYLK